MLFHSCRLQALLTKILIVVAIAVFAAPATVSATQNDAASLRAEEGDALFAALARAKTLAEGQSLENAIWMYWMKAPTQAAQRLLDRAMERRRSYDFAGAVKILDDLIGIAPSYAEGWNQRATIRFLQQDYEGSLMDIEKTLELEPRHFGAMAGQSIILMRQGRFALGQKILRRAVEIHPWLRERGALIPIPGEKI